jgi:uncharacterized protein
VIALEPRSEGVLLPVRAHPGARANAIKGEQDGMLKVSVTQAPEKGKANKAIVELLAKRLGLKKHQFALVSGETSGQKKFLVSGVSVDELQTRLQDLISAE